MPFPLRKSAELHVRQECVGLTGRSPADVFSKRYFFLTTVHTLASGSSGNAAVLSCGDTHLLIDAGISCRRITAALKELGLTPART